MLIRFRNTGIMGMAQLTICNRRMFNLRAQPLCLDEFENVFNTSRSAYRLV